MEYVYEIWGADVVSDVPLDIESSRVKVALIEGKMQIDKYGVSAKVITRKFVVQNGRLQVHPDPRGLEEYHQCLMNDGLPVMDYYETDFNLDYL